MNLYHRGSIARAIMLLVFTMWSCGSLERAEGQDCNNNGVPDVQDLDPADPDGNGEFSVDCNGNLIPDECDVPSILTSLQIDDYYAPGRIDSSVDIDGDTMVVGIPYYSELSPESGTVQFLERVGEDWIPTTRLHPEYGTQYQRFGRSIALSGSHLIVGGSNGVHCFRKENGTWVFTQFIQASNSGARIDLAVSLDTLVLGLPENDQVAIDAGRVMIYRLLDGMWELAAELAPEYLEEGDLFGHAVAISDNQVMIGAPEAFFGAIYVFEENGGNWIELQKYTGVGFSRSEEFGFDIAVDSDWMVVGARKDNTFGSFSQKGAARVFRRVDGLWVFHSTLFPLDTATDNQRFGGGVAIDGDLIAVAASSIIPSRSSVQIFQLTGGQWQRRHRLRRGPPVSSQDTELGVSLAIGQGTVVAGISDEHNDQPAFFYQTSMTLTDCDWNGIPDSCDLAALDCNANGIVDACELGLNDCNYNGIPDECDIADCVDNAFDCSDCNNNGLIDSCENNWRDCNQNGINDYCDTINCNGDYDCVDCDGNYQIDYCEFGFTDTDGDGIRDRCQRLSCTATNFSCRDCNLNQIFDDVDPSVEDCNANGIIDACEFPRVKQLVSGSTNEVPNYLNALITVDGDQAILGNGHIFERGSGGWEQVAKLGVDSIYGFTQTFNAASLNGTIAVLGRWDADDWGADDAGHVWIFESDNDGNWTQSAFLRPPEPSDYDYFGRAIEIHDESVLVACPQKDHSSYDDAGVVYVYRKIDGQWQLTQTLVEPIINSDSHFGSDIALHGNRLAVLNGPTSGSMTRFSSLYLYEWDGDNWMWQTMVTPPATIGQHRRLKTVAMNQARLAIGENVSFGDTYYAGGIHVYDFDGANWMFDTLMQSTPRVGSIGTTIALDGDAILAAPEIYDEGTDYPAVFYFEKGSNGWHQRHVYRQYFESGFGRALAFAGDEVLIHPGIYVFERRTEASSCNADFRLDDCRDDCNANGIYDECEITRGESEDCNRNGIPDECDFASGMEQDCNQNEIPDSCELANSVPIRGHRITVSNPSAFEYAGTSVVVDGDLAVLGIPDRTGEFNDEGAAAIFARTDGDWSEVTTIEASDGSFNEEFGSSVAISEPFIFVGAWHESELDGVARRGAVYVFEDVAGQWIERQKLLASDPTSAAGFGSAIAIDGQHLVIAASGSLFSTNNGVYVFENIDGLWQETTKLLPTTETSPTRFGKSIAVSNNRLVVGSPYEFMNEGTDVQIGAAYVFEFHDGAWSQTNRFSDVDDSYGLAVAVNENYAAISAPISSRFAEYGGLVEIFEYDGSAWGLTETIRPFAPATNNRMGQSLLFDGSQLIITSSSADLPVYDHGVIHIHERLEANWIQTAKIPQREVTGGGFSYFVSKSGNDLLIGTPGYSEFAPSSGAAVFVDLATLSNDCDADLIIDTCQPNLSSLARFVGRLLDASAASEIDLCVFDGDRNGLIDGRDIAIVMNRLSFASACNSGDANITDFVIALLDSTIDDTQRCLYDSDNDGSIDGRDIQAFVQSLLP